VDLALVGGKVITMNPTHPLAEAVAIDGARIVKVGTNLEITRLINKKTKIIRLNGKTVLPGFIDTHIHVLDFGKMLSWLDLTNVRSIAELQDAVKKRIEDSPKGSWILGRGWNEARFSDKHMPNRSDLDLFTPENPLILYHEIAQACLVNSKTLDLASIGEGTSDPQGGSIERDTETDAPTGILRDSATDLVWRIVPELGEEELLEAAALACAKIVQAGVTSVHWMVLERVELAVAQRLHLQKRLPIRVNLIVPVNLIDAIQNFRSNDSLALRVGGVIIAVDGYLAAKTAALSQPYSDDLAHSGDLLATPEEIIAMAMKISKTGFQVLVHAMGDKAVDVSLNAIGKAMDSASSKEARVRLEQAALVDERLIERIKRQKVIVSVQPLVISSEFSVWHALEHLGTIRARWLFPLQTFIENGVRLIGGSDCPMEPLNPLLGIQAALVRSHFPEEQVKIEEALRMYTIDAAYSSGEEGFKGSIEEGKLADLVVLSKDPLLTSPDALNRIDVELTVVDGRIVNSKLD